MKLELSFIFEDHVKVTWTTVFCSSNYEWNLIPGSGLGRLMATKFAGLGCTLVLWDISEEGNKETARQIQKLGAKAYCYTCDLSDREAIYKAADQVT